MTDISVYTRSFQAENLTWDLSTADMPGFAQGGTLDTSLFTAAQHYPNGYIPSGTVLGVVTATGKLGPYLSTASDGRQTAVGVLRRSTQVLRGNGSSIASVGAAYLVGFSAVSVSKLPFTSGTAANGGYIDTAARTALRNIYFAA